MLRLTTRPIAVMAQRKKDSIPEKACAKNTSQFSTTKPINNSSPYTFLCITATEASVALMSTNARFNQQFNAVFKTKNILQPEHHPRGGAVYIPTRMAQFYAMTQAKEKATELSQTHFPMESPTFHAIAGATGASAAGIPFSLPLEILLLKGLRNQIYDKPFNSFQYAKKIFIDAFFGKLRGTAATTYRDIPYGAFTVSVPGYIEQKLNQSELTNYLPTFVKKAVATTISATTFVLLTQPQDVIKTLIQIDPSVPDNIILAGKDIIESRGVSALYSGSLCRLSKNMATIGILGFIEPLNEFFSNT